MRLNTYLKGIIFSFVLVILGTVASCKRDEEPLKLPLEESENPNEQILSMEPFREVIINADVDGNYEGQLDPERVFSLSQDRKAYCHPDVQYFPQGFRGYRYWMVFTPYFGAVSGFSKYSAFENPTIVTSNDGINWDAPAGVKNPLIKCPSPQESFSGKLDDEDARGYWSDVDWEFYNNKFYLYYRSSWVSARALQSRGSKSANNAAKLSKGNPQRAVLRQTSDDGANWSPLEVCYTSDEPATPQNNFLLSPTVLHSGREFVSYEVLNNNLPDKFPGNKASYILRRTSADGVDFTNYKQGQWVQFANEPWLKLSDQYSPWHVQACMYDDYYFLIINVGTVKKSMGDALYLAYSRDGVNFRVCKKAIEEHNAYRSCVFPVSSDKNTIYLGAMVANTQGHFKYTELKIRKDKMIN